MELKPCVNKTINSNSIQKHGLELVRCSSSHQASTVIKKLKGNHGLVGSKITNKRKREEEEEEAAPPSLPKDVIVSILLLLPAKVLKDNMRVTCWEWHNIIKDPDFVHTHFQLSSSGVLVLDRTREQRWGLYIEKKGIELSLTELKLPFPAQIMGSCRGTILLHDQTYVELFHIVTLVSKSVLTLPWIPVLPYLERQITALAIASSGHYKVVHVFGSMYKWAQIMVYTVGIDKAWRPVGYFCSPRQEAEVQTLFQSPFSGAGFIYWWYSVYPFGFVFDVNSEKMYKFTLPESYSSPRKSYHSVLLDLESGLGFAGYDHGKLVWEIYELTDLMCSNWTKLSEVNLSFLGHQLESIIYPRPCVIKKPLLCMKDGDIWFHSLIDDDLALVCFNPKHGYILPCPMDNMNSYDRPYVHVNSLLSLKNY